MGEMIEVAARDGSGSFGAYRALPAGAPKGAILVVQEIFGLNPGMRARVDRWAAQGYAAYALDLFWRDTPGLSLDPDVPEQMQQAFGHLGHFDTDKGIEDIEALIRFARAETGGKVGVTGYCLGGLLTFLAAARTDGDAFAAYYGGQINTYLREAHAIGKPLLMHFAELDHFIPLSAVDEIRDVFAGDERVEIHVYEGVDHGFATEAGKRRIEAAADLADSRTRDFMARHIG